MDYVSAATSNLGYCETVEKLMGVEVPRRARYIRTILMELQRIASHCLWVGTHAMDIGAMTVFLYAFRERELILDLFEEFCGARLTYNSMRIGGLPLDIPPGWDKKVLAFCKIMDSKVDEYETLLTHNQNGPALADLGGAFQCVSLESRPTLESGRNPTKRHAPQGIKSVTRIVYGRAEGFIAPSKRVTRILSTRLRSISTTSK